MFTGLNSVNYRYLEWYMYHRAPEILASDRVLTYYFRPFTSTIYGGGSGGCWSFTFEPHVSIICLELFQANWLVDDLLGWTNQAPQNCLQPSPSYQSQTFTTNRHPVDVWTEAGFSLGSQTYPCLQGFCDSLCVVPNRIRGIFYLPMLSRLAE